MVGGSWCWKWNRLQILNCGCGFSIKMCAFANQPSIHLNAKSTDTRCEAPSLFTLQRVVEYVPCKGSLNMYLAKGLWIRIWQRVFEYVSGKGSWNTYLAKGLEYVSYKGSLNMYLAKGLWICNNTLLKKKHNISPEVWHHPSLSCTNHLSLYRTDQQVKGLQRNKLNTN